MQTMRINVWHYRRLPNSSRLVDRTSSFNSIRVGTKYILCSKRDLKILFFTKRKKVGEWPKYNLELLYVKNDCINPVKSSIFVLRRPTFEKKKKVLVCTI